MIALCVDVNFQEAVVLNLWQNLRERTFNYNKLWQPAKKAVLYLETKLYEQKIQTLPTLGLGGKVQKYHNNEKGVFKVDKNTRGGGGPGSNILTSKIKEYLKNLNERKHR